MKKATLVSVAISTLALGLAVGGSAQADTSAPEASGSSQDPSASQSSASPDQARIAETTLKLENAFSDQFVKGQIDRDALAPLISDVVQAMPEAARSNVQAHIDDVIALGERTAPQMTPEERTQLATPPAADKMTKTQIAIIGGFGWGGLGGWGGGGAFGFPGWGGFGGGGWGGWGGWGGFGGFGGWGGWGGWGGGWRGFGGWGGFGGWRGRGRW